MFIDVFSKSSEISANSRHSIILAVFERIDDYTNIRKHTSCESEDGIRTLALLLTSHVTLGEPKPQFFHL